MDRPLVNRILATVAAALLLIALLTPWWTLVIQTDGSFNGFDMSDSGDVSAKPFDDGIDGDEGIIKTGEAVTSGILVLLALLAAAGAAALAWMGDPKRIGGWLAAGSSLATALAVILAVATWPGNGLGFWDSESGSGGGFSTEVTSFASFGWYTAAVTALLSGYVAVQLLLARPAATPTQGVAARVTPVEAPTVAPHAAAPVGMAATAAPAAASAAGQCHGVTKAGARCARKASAGRFCSAHAA